VKDKYPLTRMEDVIHFAGQHRFLSVIDCKLGFHNLAIHPTCRPKTAFLTPLGQYEYCRQPFGWCNDPAEFQRQIDLTLENMKDKWALAYLDDIIIGGRTKKEHDLRLNAVLKLSTAEVFRSRALRVRFWVLLSKS
jgi:hypothetical protein